MKMAFCAGALAAAVASVASADTAISLGKNSLFGGATNTYTFNLSVGVSDFEFSFDYVDGNSASWSSDVMLTIVDPNGVARHWGGFNVAPPAAGSVFANFWSFDGSASTNSGFYSDLANTYTGTQLSGAGTWTFHITNGWNGATAACQYNNVNLLLKGSIVPAPGAVALLGLAGLVGRRRRA